MTVYASDWILLAVWRVQLMSAVAVEHVDLDRPRLRQRRGLRDDGVDGGVGVARDGGHEHERDEGHQGCGERGDADQARRGVDVERRGGTGCPASSRASCRPIFSAAASSSVAWTAASADGKR